MEKWKDIPGYEGLYQGSSLGRIKSLPRKVKTYKGGTYKAKVKILKYNYDTNGYTSVSLSYKGKVKRFSIHRLILLIFEGESILDVNHKDGKKDNNILKNLEYVTKSENNKHAYSILGRKPSSPWKGKKGFLHNCAIPVKQYSKQGKFIKNWGSMIDIKREMGISAEGVSMCCRGKLKTSGNFIWKFDRPVEF